MANIADAFAKLLQRQPSDAEMLELVRIRDTLELNNNDALWLVLIALQYYRSLYDEYPSKIARTTQKVLAETEAVAKAKLRASVEQTKADLSRAVAESAQKIAAQTAGRKMYQWMTGFIFGSVLVLSTIGWLSFEAGKNAGRLFGYEQARDEKAAASWANSREGRDAYALFQAGSIRALANCEKPGWILQDKICFPKSATDGLHGWKIR